MKEKKQVLNSSIAFPGYYRNNINIFNEKLTNGLSLLQNDLANFIVLLKYCQRRFDLNTCEKLIVFVTMQYIYIHLLYTKISYFLPFFFEGKLIKCDISVKRKHTNTNEKMIFSVLYTNFR